MQVAVIDLGTNTFHLLIARVSEGRFRVIHKEKVPVEVGRGGINHGKITADAYLRALSAMRHFKTLLDLHNTRQVVSTATSAFRSASNGEQLLEDILQDTGIATRIIDGQDEASFIFEGVQNALSLKSAPSLIMDIGGGSVEFIIANKTEILWKDSFEIGVQRLADKFQHHDPILPSEHQHMLLYLLETLTPLHEAILEFNPVELIGSSGTFDTLFEIYRLRQGLNRERGVTELLLPVDPLREIFDQVFGMNHNQRLAVPGMIPMRADLIIESATLIQVALQLSGASQIRVSLYGLKEGILYSHFLLGPEANILPIGNSSNSLL